MTENMDSRKYRLIEQIMRLDREEDLNKLEDQVESFHNEDDLRFMNAIKTIRKSVTLEDLIAEHHYQPIQKEEFFRKTGELEFEESLEDLLSQLD